MTITSLPTPPSTSAPSTFATLADAFIAALPTFVSEANTQAAANNTLAAAISSMVAGGAMTIPYTFSTTTADSDPGNGILRLDNATQNTATTIRADLLGSDASTYTSVIDTFDDSTSTIKGFIALEKVSDTTKFLIFSVSALASPAGYKNITVANVASSAASPFTNGDALVLKFTRNGDKGDTGTTGTTGAAGSNGKVAQIVLSETSAVATGSTAMPYDDTIPQNTEGDQYMSATITPLASSSTLLVEVVAMVASATASLHICGALFRDTTANAFAATAVYEEAAVSKNRLLVLSASVAAGSTAATTFKFRAGVDSGATMTFNGSANARKFGGITISSIRITEISA